MKLLQAIRGVGRRINRPINRPLKMALVLSLLVHVFGLPLIFNSFKRDKTNPKQTPKEMVIDIELEKPVKKKCGGDCALPDNKTPASLPKKKEKQLAMLQKKSAPRIRIRKYKRRAEKPKSPKPAARQKAKAKTKANNVKTKPVALAKLMPRMVTVVREGKIKVGGSYISSDILKDSGNAVDRIFSGSNGSSFADNGRLPKVGGGCGSGNCDPVTFIGKREGKYYWKDRSGKYYYSTTYPKPGECFQATPTSRPK